MRSTRQKRYIACILGVSIAIGSIAALYAPGIFDNSKRYANNYLKTEIPINKLILLDYFIFMPWLIENFDQVAYFHEIDYNDPVEESGYALYVLHSPFFLLGALIAVGLGGTENKMKKDPHEEGSLPTWILYTLIMTFAHILLILAATTYYTGPGEPAWVYPSPIGLIPFTGWIGMVSIFADMMYEGYYNRKNIDIYQ